LQVINKIFRKKMNIAFFVYHPVEPQMYFPIANKLKKEGNNVIFILLEKENIEEILLKNMGFPYFKVKKYSSSIVSKLIKLFQTLFYIKKILDINKTDIVFSATSIYAGIPAYLTRSLRIGFTDTETAKINNSFAFPFFQSIITPDCFYERIPKKKHIPVKSYKEFAYLHPSRFVQNDKILHQLGINSCEKIVLLRFSALHAAHDIGLKSKADKYYEQILYYIKKLSKYAKVFISCTEKELGVEFEEYKLNIHPSQYIHLLSFCSLYIGEGTTTASEAGVLGVPWIALRPVPLGYLNDQEENYGLGFRTDNISYAFETALRWIPQDNIKEVWQQKRQKLFVDKIDFAAFLVWFIENYPQSHVVMKKDVTFQNKFR